MTGRDPSLQSRSQSAAEASVFNCKAGGQKLHWLSTADHGFPYEIQSAFKHGWISDVQQQLAYSVRCLLSISDRHWRLCHACNCYQKTIKNPYNSFSGGWENFKLAVTGFCPPRTVKTCFVDFSRYWFILGDSSYVYSLEMCSSVLLLSCLLAITLSTCLVLDISVGHWFDALQIEKFCNSV